MYQLRIEGGGNDQWGQSLKPAKTTVKKNDFDFNAAVKNLNDEAKINNANGLNGKLLKDMVSEESDDIKKINYTNLLKQVSLFSTSKAKPINPERVAKVINMQTNSDNWIGKSKPITSESVAKRMRQRKIDDLLKPRSLEPADPQLPAESIHIYKPDLDKLKDTNGAIIDIHKLPSKFFPRPDGKGGVTMIENPKYDEQMQQLNKPDFRLAIRGEEIPVDKE